MKKILTALLIAALTLTMFAACGNKDTGNSTETTATAQNDNVMSFPSTVKGVKEFKNDAGKVVYKVEYEIPWLDSTYSEEAQVQFNNYIQVQFLDMAYGFAESNVNNVRDNETEPRVIKISHKYIYRTDNIMSVAISTAYSSKSSVDVYRTFDLNTGFVLHAEELFTGNVEETKKVLFDCLLPDAVKLLPEKPEMTAEERKALAAEKLAAGFESASFYVTDIEIGFVYNLSAFQEGIGAGAGTHAFVLDLNTYSYLGITNTLENVAA